MTARPSQGCLGVDIASDPEVRQETNESTAMLPSLGGPDTVNGLLQMRRARSRKEPTWLWASSRKSSVKSHMFLNSKPSVLGLFHAFPNFGVMLKWRRQVDVGKYKKELQFKNNFNSNRN